MSLPVCQDAAGKRNALYLIAKSRSRVPRQLDNQDSAAEKPRRKHLRRKVVAGEHAVLCLGCLN